MSGSEAAAPLLRVVCDVLRERVAQEEKWGEQNHPDSSCDPFDRPVITSTAAKRLTDERTEAGTVSWTDIAVEELAEALDEAEAGNTDALRTELIQLAAVCVQWVQAIDRRSS